MMTRRSLLPLALAALVLAPAATRADDIVTTASNDPQFSTLVAAVKAAGLVETLQGEGPFTVLAPTNSAFSALGSGTVEALTQESNKDRLTGIITYHVVPAAAKAAEVSEMKYLPTVNGQKLPVLAQNGTVRVGGARVVRTDIECDNGVIHVIDTVLLPTDKNLVETAEKAGQFGKLIAAAKAAGLAEALTGDGPLTVFAPTDSAFARLPAGTVEDLLKPENKEKLAGILKLHVVDGTVMAGEALEAKEATALSGGTLNFAVGNNGPTVNGATIRKTDVVATNGVIHVIDQVLLPQEGDSEETAEEMSDEGPEA